MQADIGLIGLAVMGQNLVLNMEGKGYTVAVYNRTAQRTEEFEPSGPREKTSSPPTASATSCRRSPGPARSW